MKQWSDNTSWRNEYNWRMEDSERSPGKEPGMSSAKDGHWHKVRGKH